MTTVLNYGGGRQTVALCLLIQQSKVPRPDRVIIADTGREKASTWDYLAEVTRPLLASIGLAVEVAPHTLATVDLYAHNGDLLLPAYTATGKLSAFCSMEWKARVVQRSLRAQGIDSAEQWIGFALDERGRIKSQDAGPWVRTYPLIDLMLTKRDCRQIITDAGLPMPPPSACYMCPNLSNEEWRYVRDHYPQDFKQAVQIDEEIRENDERGGVWLHPSRVPLAHADLDAPDRKGESRQCGLGLCFV